MRGIRLEMNSNRDEIASGRPSAAYECLPVSDLADFHPGYEGCSRTSVKDVPKAWGRGERRGAQKKSRPAATFRSLVRSRECALLAPSTRGDTL
jgi:hypothetical protein